MLMRHDSKYYWKRQCGLKWEQSSPKTLTPNPSPIREQHAMGEGNYLREWNNPERKTTMENNPEMETTISDES
jgi:hypothetical protein